MANRRMISNTVVRTARFLRMPPTTQNLYFHLVLNTDDDGVVEAFPVMRLIGATEDDLKILVEKVFVYLLNEDLVVYISDWNEQNTIRSDRKVDSVYKNLLLKIVPDIEYKESTKKNGQSVVRQMSDKSQQDDRLSKDKLSKDKLREGSSSNVGIQNVDIGNEDIRNVDIQFVDNSSSKEESLKTVFTFWEQNGFGTISPLIIEHFTKWVEDFKEIGATTTAAIELIVHSLVICVERGKRNYGYAKAILTNWENQRYLTVDQVKAEDKKNSSSNNKRQWPDYSIGNKLENTGSSEYDNLGW
ncbi:MULTISPECIES: DnaD domain-containing protein [Enterococcus]|uniref:DnaD domain-containing protein n=1 Tax=Enterococcus TaxID=1350 RepID=UPI0022E8F113|nr:MULTISPECIES: DnaD domain protein [Enterococcus]MDT2646328.1 DnaD domain protein [Enterococcus dongliensis]